MRRNLLFTSICFMMLSLCGCMQMEGVLQASKEQAEESRILEEDSESESVALNEVEIEEEVSEKLDSNDMTESSEDVVMLEPVTAYDDIISDFEKIIEYRLSDNFNGLDNIELYYSDTLKSAIDKNDLSYYWTCMIAEPPLYSEDFNTAGFGYILHDMNNDGISELFLAGKNHTILAVFTLVDEEPVLLTAFWSRHRGVISEEGFLVCNGSSGAADNTLYVYSLSSDGMLEVEYGTKSESNYLTDPVSIKYYIFKNDEEALVSFDEYEEFRKGIRMEQRAFWLLKEVNQLFE